MTLLRTPACVAATLGCLACDAGVGAEIEIPGRIVLFSMDTVRADRVGGYGGEATPELDRIATEGVLFRDFYAASTYTIPSTMSIFTGRDPGEHGVAARAARVSDELPLLTELLSAAGWRTRGFHEGVYVAGRFGFERGFDEYSEYGHIEVVDEALPEVLAWIRAAGDARYFLFLHTYAAHFPFGGMERYRREQPARGLPTPEEIVAYRAEVEEREREGRSWPKKDRQRFATFNYFVDHLDEKIGPWALIGPGFEESRWFRQDVEQMLKSYDERIRRIDTAIGAIRDVLVELGQWEDTLLIVLSDHGEAFFEHGMERHDAVPFEEGLRVPLIVSYPRLLANSGGRVVEGLAWHLDVMPTILALAGVPAPPGLAGFDLTPVLAGTGTIPADRAIFPAVLRPAFREQLPLRRVAVQARWKHIAGHEHFGDDAGFLFDLDSDPSETTNLRSTDPEKYAELAALAGAYERGLVLVRPVHQETGLPLSGEPGDDEIDLPEDELERLRELGYVE